ncbi:hypothetical protein CHARACLAT_031157 [Characodon lateralis]|uniref:Uncharacterized protein n=1 Tax=Characodon lateralis TaxID=208331 RepID=A0ABU7EYW6_9TELE|nr:hypothetical protein [Characodon lateralis]
MVYYLHATGVHSTTNQAHPSLSLLYLSRQIYKVILFTCARIEFYSEKEFQLKASPKTPLVINLCPTNVALLLRSI